METKQDQQPLTHPETTVAPWTAAVLSDVKTIIAQGRQTAYQGANAVLIRTYWQVGRRIVEEEQQGEQRAAYGIQLIDFLAESLSKEFPMGYKARDLRNYRQFYLMFNDLEIWHARVPNLSWTHFRTLLQTMRMRVIGTCVKRQKRCGARARSTVTSDRNTTTDCYVRPEKKR